MDTICERKSFEVGGRCGGDEKKQMTTQNRQSRTLKKDNIAGNIFLIIYSKQCIHNSQLITKAY